MPQTSLLKKFLRNKRYFFTIFALAVAGFAFLFFGYSLFTVSSIELYGLDKETPLLGLKTIKRKNIFFITQEAIQKNIVETNIFIKEAKLVKKYPNTLQLYIDMETPLAVVQSGDKGYLALSEAGKILYKKRNKVPFLPVIRYYQSFDYDALQAGDMISYRDIQIALQFIKQSGDLDLNVDSVDIEGFSMIALNIGEQRVLFTTEKDEAVQNYQFITVIKQFKIEGKQFASLDLRFDKPVAIFKD